MQIVRPVVIYALVDPITIETRYIGWCYQDRQKARFREHIGRSGGIENTHKSRWINSLVVIGEKPKMEIVCFTIIGKNDYGMSARNKNEPYADYVFGRMMKMRLSYDGDGIELPQYKLRADYESWVRTFPSFEVLADATAKDLNCKMRLV